MRGPLERVLWLYLVHPEDRTEVIRAWQGGPNLLNHIISLFLNLILFIIHFITLHITFLWMPDSPQQDSSAHVYWKSLIAKAKDPEPQNWRCLYTLSPHPLTAGHATSPGTQLQPIRAAGARLHQIWTCLHHQLCIQQVPSFRCGSGSPRWGGGKATDSHISP